MGKCLKGESEVKKKEAKYTCGKCGGRTAIKDHVCKPEPVKPAKEKHKKDKGGKKKRPKKD